MTNQTNINVRIDANVKSDAEQILEELGINLSTAINIFLRQVIRQRGIPFEVKLNAPNKITASAIREGRRLIKDENTTGYNNMDDLKAALDL